MDGLITFVLGAVASGVYYDVLKLYINEKILKRIKTLQTQGETEEAERLIQQELENQPELQKTVTQHLTKVQNTRLPHTSNTKLFGREKELTILENAWATPQTTNILVLKAMGGTGKTALIKNFLDDFHAANAFKGAEAIYTWSFYSQGSSEERQVSADEFFDQALAFFGYQGEQITDYNVKACKLAELIKQQRTLLVLDGIEPLQHPVGVMHGDLKDKGLIALLQQLAVQNQGLCLISSRQEVTELHNKPLVLAYNLEQLATPDGVALLQSFGVTGKSTELETAVKELHGHALALNLLGNYLKTFYQGDIRQRDKILALSDERDEGNHAQHVMAAYEIHLKDSTALSILYMMGLFDRPASSGAIQCLRDANIAGLSDKLGNNADWLYAVQDLRQQQLLNTPDPKQPDNLDTHPLIREYFGNRLKQTAPDAWQNAHQSLYEYYKALPDKQQPDTLEAMEPLFAAIAHGCKAGLYQQALKEVYYPRIQRGGQTNYLCNKLGAFGADLSALSHFFSQHWQTPAEALTDFWKAAVLNWAAFRLRALGRLQEAVEPMQAGLDIQTNNEEWESAASAASNLSELQLTRGELALAIRSAEQSVTLADKSEDLFQRMARRTTLADALHQTANIPQALSHFKTAEDLQQENQAEFPQLYSLQGFRYCDCLLSTGQWREVQQRADYALNIVLNGSRNLLDIALNQLSLGRANLIEWLSQYSQNPQHTVGRVSDSVTRQTEANTEQLSQDNNPQQTENYPLPEYMPLDTVILLGYATANPTYNSGNNPPNNKDKLQTAGDWLNQAVEGLRNSGYEYYLPLGLLARASFYRYCHINNNAKQHALADLQETHDIAQRSGMKLHLCDYHLESTRLALTLNETVHNQTAEQHLQQAEQLIKETGYKRRLPEVEYLQAFL